MNKTKEFLGKSAKEVFVEIDILRYLVKGLMLHWAWFMAFLLLLMSSVTVSIVIFLIWQDSLWFYFFPSLPGDIPNHWEPICQTCGWKHSCSHLWFSCSICMSSEAAWKACVWVGICFIIIFNLLTANTLQGSDGKIFFQMLWASLEAVILKIHSSTLSGSNISGEERLARCNTHTADYHTTGFISILLPKLLNANWATATGLVQVLRKILKSLKTDYGELAEEYLQSFSYSLQNVSWDLLHESHVDKFSGTWMKYSKDSLLHRDMCSPGLKEIFLGTLLQLFCTLVDPNSFKETSGSNFDELPFLPEVINLVPSLLCWCLSSRVNCKQSYMSRYLRHKMLVSSKFCCFFLWQY